MPTASKSNATSPVFSLATPATAARARGCEIYEARRFSDHAPLIVEYAGRL
jgi:exodeoxyribonuclease-3